MRNDGAGTGRGTRGLRRGAGLAGWLVMVLAVVALAAIPYNAMAKPGNGKGGGGGNGHGGGHGGGGKEAVATGMVWRDNMADGVMNDDDRGESQKIVWADLDGDGLREQDEPQATTASDGTYTLGPLPQGQYEIRTVPEPSDWVHCSYPAGGGYPVKIGKGKPPTLTGLDFGIYTTVGMSGTVFEDLTGDGSKSGPGLAGWTVYLDLNNNSALDDDEPVAVTDETGYFVFDNQGSLLPGTYQMREVVQDGWTLTWTNVPDPVTVKSFSILTNVKFSNALN